jgi:hypothetical protein
VPVPSLARWLLALGIAATLTANMAQGWSHGPVGAVVAAWPAASLVGPYELLIWLIHTCGAADRGPSAEDPGNGAPCRAAAHCVPASDADGDRPAGSERGTADPAWRPAGRAVGIPAGGQRDDETLEASAVNDAAVAAYRLSVQAGNRFRNAGSPRCSDERPAAGREPESPTHDRHRRSQTRRAPPVTA